MELWHIDKKSGVPGDCLADVIIIIKAAKGRHLPLQAPLPVGDRLLAAVPGIYLQILHIFLNIYRLDTFQVLHSEAVDRIMGINRVHLHKKVEEYPYVIGVIHSCPCR